MAQAWSLWSSLGSPQWIAAPMVLQSELPFRSLVRRHGVQMAYTPMIKAHLFLRDSKTYGKEEGRRRHFTSNEADRPLVVQFCSRDPERTPMHDCHERVMEDHGRPWRVHEGHL